MSEDLLYFLHGKLDEIPKRLPITINSQIDMAFVEYHKTYATLSQIYVETSRINYS